MPTAAEKRAAVIRTYETILGRNKYSQPRRSYAFKKYSDGKYYSDCSSSVALAYKYAGYPFYDNNGSYNPNTVGMYQAKSLKDVPVIIEKGIIQNPEILRPGDMLLFAGTDSSRSYAGYVGHVEMVAKIECGRVTIYGHGSGTPRATEMNAYCKSRYSKKTSTKLGHRGLIRVRRFIWDDGDGGVYLTRGMESAEVKALQQNLMKLGYDLLEWGDDGEFGSETEDALKRFQTAQNLPVTGIYDTATDKAMQAALGLPAAPEAPAVPTVLSGSGYKVKITGNTVNVRTGPGKNYTSIHVAEKGEVFDLPDASGWTPIKYGGHVYWVSDTYSEMVKE